MKHEQNILVEYNNTSPFVYKVISDKKITINKVLKALKENGEVFNEEKDCLTFIDTPIIWKI